MDPTDVIHPGPDGPPRRGRRRGSRVPSDVQEISLRDGSRVWVRSIRPDDRERLVQGLQWLSPRSRYMRFHSHVQRLTSSQLDYLVDVDHHDHEAIVAIDPDLEGEPGVAVARYIRLREEPAVAEAAITVIDSHQGRGIGTALICLLERKAHEEGITTFRNYVLAENTAMLEIFRQLDGEVARESPGVYRVDVPVPGPDDAQPDSPAGRWVSSVGRHTAERRDAWPYPVIWLMRWIGVDESASPSGESRLLKRWASNEGASNEGAPDDGASNEGAPDDGASNEGAPDDGASNEGAPDDGASNEGAPDEDSTSP